METEEPRQKKSWPAEEEIILARWQKGKIFSKTLARKSPKGNFVFYEGPPTANAAPGVHHVLARVFKDIIVRFRTMQGYHVERKAGWDTHGLPVELQVEKKLGLKSKPEIETYGIAKFNAECRELVWQFKDDWEKLTERIGFWLDLKRPYVTYENDYIESVWSVIAKAHARELLYQGHKVVPYCPRCGTSLSSHEVALGYRKIKEDSVYVKCRVTVGNQFVQKGDFILTWTTTPWTLPGNVALAVGPDIDYVLVEFSDQKRDEEGNVGHFRAVVAKSIFELWKNHHDLPHDSPHFQFIREGGIEYFSGILTDKGEGAGGNRPPKVIHEFRGKDLVGVEYKPLFPGAVEKGNAKVTWQVVPADFVTTTDGTGVVHTAVMYGEDDYRLGEQVGLPKQHTVGLDGKFLPRVTGLAGKYVKAKDTQELIYDHLKRNGAFMQTALYEHDYPFCWRCDSPLLYYAKDSWFVAMTKVKDELLKNAEQISWEPAHIKEGRFGEWISGVKDWAISRERYWGTPLPVWECRGGRSRKQEAGSRESAGEGCGHWQVVGSVAELKKLAKKIPKDLHRPFIDAVTFSCAACGGTMRRVPEVMDVWLDSGSMPFAQYHYPFENEELIDGKLSTTKSKKTYKLPPTSYKLGAQYPADYICEAIDQTRGWFYTLLAVSTIMGKGTSYRNVICLGHINDASGRKMSKSKGNIVNPWDVINKFGTDPLRWYLYTINQPGEAKNFDLKQIDEVVKKVFLILQNVVAFYRLYVPNPKAQVVPPRTEHVLDLWILARISQLSVTVTEALSRYGVIEAARPMSDFITDLSTWYVRRSRDRFKAGDPEAMATLGYVLLQTAKLLAPFTPFFAEYVYREVGGKLASVHLEDWPKRESVDPVALEAMTKARAVVTEGLALRMSAGLKVRQPLAAVTGPAIGAELQDIVKEELNVLEYRTGTTVALDTAMTDQLRVAGLARELVRCINNLRKAAALTVADRIAVTYDGALDDVLASHRDEVLRKTNALTITTGTGGEPVTLNDRAILLRISKV
ncbi:MAG: isoleucyl-tRNA synthetase [Parcubacteria group bacterium Gr01-1014_31]|nr:MAG: isoleucyl-tRNA synthetase [Parcubacteria group bacterium Gr01-1014_31]